MFKRFLSLFSMSAKTKNILKAVGIDIGKVLYGLLFIVTAVFGIIVGVVALVVLVFEGVDKIALEPVIFILLCAAFQAYHHRQKFKDYLDDAVRRNINKEPGKLKNKVDAWGRCRGESWDKRTW